MARLARTRARRPLGGEAGLNLLDVTVAVSILASLLVVGAPFFASLLPSYGLRRVTHDVFGALQSARTAAVMQNNRHRVSFPDATHYRVHDDDDNDGVEDAGELVVTRDILEEGGTFSLSAGGPITFVPNGTSLGAGSVTVSTPGAADRQVTVSAAGRVRIE